MYTLSTSWAVEIDSHLISFGPQHYSHNNVNFTSHDHCTSLSNKPFNGSSQPGPFTWHTVSSRIWPYLPLWLHPFILAHMPYTPAKSIYSGSSPTSTYTPTSKSYFLSCPWFWTWCFLFCPKVLSQTSPSATLLHPSKSSSSVIFVTPFADVPALDWVRNPLYAHSLMLSSIIILPSANLQICLHSLLWAP